MTKIIILEIKSDLRDSLVEISDLDFYNYYELVLIGCGKLMSQNRLEFQILRGDSNLLQSSHVLFDVLINFIFIGLL